MEIRRYVTRAGKDVFGEWLARLADVQARARVVARVDRLAVGNFGDSERRFGTADRLGAGVSRLLRDHREGVCVAAMWRRQTQAEIRY